MYLCKLFGKDLIHIDSKTKKLYYENTIVSDTIEINRFLASNDNVDFSKFEGIQSYNKWCNIIHFFTTYCCIGVTNKKIDYSIIRHDDYQSIWVTRDKYIDKASASSIIGIVVNYDAKYSYEIQQQADYSGFKEQLKIISKLFS